MRQDKCLFQTFVNNIEDFFYVHGAEGVDITLFKLFVLLYADDINIFFQKPLMVCKNGRHFKGILYQMEINCKH